MRDPHIPFSITRRRVLLAIVLGSACVLCTVLIGFNNVHRLELAMNQIGWQSTRPVSYYMVVDEYRFPKGEWQWAAHVQGGQSTTVNLLRSSEFSSGARSAFTRADTTIDKIFELAQECASDAWYCGLEFDPQYHYLRKMTYLDSFAIEVIRFIPCGESAETCPGAAEPK